MPRRILVLADLYPPHFAPRVLSLVRYWVSLGWQVVVATEEIKQWNSSGHGRVFEGVEDLCPTYRIPLRKSYSVWESLEEAFFSTKERAFGQVLERQLKMDEFDLIVSFSYRTFPHGTAAQLAQKYHLPVVMDSRDIVEQYPRYEFLPSHKGQKSLPKKLFLSLLKHQYIRQRNRAFRSAQKIVTVSPWHQNVLQKATKGIPVEVLYNGYDRSLFYPREPERTPRFTLLFTGRLLTLARSNPSPLFEALSSDALRPIIEEGLLEVAWYVDEQSRELIEECLSRFPAFVASLQQIHSMQPFVRVPHLLQQSSMVLMLGTPETPHGAHGIVSTKIFEALAMEKPILMVMGDKAIGEEILKRARGGCPAGQISEIIDYICHCYEQWRSLGYTQIVEPNREYIATFARDEIAKHYTSILEEVLASYRRL